MISMASRLPNQMQTDLHNKGDKSKGTSTTICEDLNQTIYRERPENNYWSARTLPGMTFLLIIFKKISWYKYAQVFYMMWNKLKLNWLQCAKKWETSEQNFKNTELIAWKEMLDHGLPPKKETKKLSGSVTIVIKTDTHQNGVVKKCETKKYEKYNMKCPPLEITLLTGTIALKLSTAASNTIKTRTNLLIRMMATIQLMNINLPKKKPGKMNPTKSLHVKGDPFQGTVVWILMWHKSPQLESLTMNCLTRFHWATEAFKKIILYVLLSHYFFMIRNVTWWYVSYCLRIILQLIVTS